MTPSRSDLQTMILELAYRRFRREGRHLPAKAIFDIALRRDTRAHVLRQVRDVVPAAFVFPRAHPVAPGEGHLRIRLVGVDDYTTIDDLRAQVAQAGTYVVWCPVSLEQPDVTASEVVSTYAAPTPAAHVAVANALDRLVHQGLATRRQTGCNLTAAGMRVAQGLVANNVAKGQAGSQ